MKLVKMIKSLFCKHENKDVSIDIDEHGRYVIVSECNKCNKNANRVDTYLSKEMWNN